MPAAATATRIARERTEEKPFRRGLIGSLIFHGLIIALCIFGLPYFHHKLPDVDEPMSIELVKQTDIAHNNQAPMKSTVVAPPVKVKPTPTPPTPTPPKAAPKAPPKPVEPVKPPAPVKEAPPIAKVMSDLALPVKKPVKQKPPEEKPVEKPAEKQVTPQDQAAFNSVLKNLITAPPATSGTPAGTADKPALAPQNSDEMSEDEFAALRRQLSECWNMIAGARNAEDLAVDVHMIVGQDRVVQSAAVADQMRYNTDTYFRAAADSALRAVRNPHCTPLNLPTEKYEQWHDITVTFDPKDML